MLSNKLNYLIVQRSVPGYRAEFFRRLNSALDGRLVVASGDERDPLKDAGVRWVRAPLFEHRVVIQYVPLALLKSSRVVIFELNPRALSTWIYLTVMKLGAHRSVLWGHRHSRRGTRPTIRRWIDHLADATVYYTVAEAERESREGVLGRKLYSAPNTLHVQYRSNNEVRRDIVLSARLIDEKDPLLAVRAVSASGLTDTTLHVVGDGPLRDIVADEARRLGVDVVFHGAVYASDKLAEIYQRAFAALSPGCVGLSVNQAVLSGVPLVYRADAHHGPEVAYADSSNSVAVEGADLQAWGSALVDLRKNALPDILEPDELAATSYHTLGLGAMVAGMREAITER